MKATTRCLVPAALALAAAMPVAAQPRAVAPQATAVAASGAAAPAAAAPVFNHGLFTNVQVHRPAGTPKQFVLLLSPGNAPGAPERELIASFVARGALVAAVPIATFQAKLEAEDGTCTFAAGAFENLSRHLQASEKLPTYLLPIVVGSGTAGSYAYALLAQAPPGTFAGGISLDFCPQFMFREPPCNANDLRSRSTGRGNVVLLPSPRLAAPWTALPGGGAAACRPADAQAFVQQVGGATWMPTPGLPAVESAYAALAARETGLAPPPAQLADLPIVEVPATGTGTGTSANNQFAVLLSGDGGWASIDKNIAAGLAKRGIPVAGFDSLRYFWSERTPEGLAADLDRIVRFYAARWKRPEVILIGYSQGADVLPFAVNRLPSRTRASVRLTALLALGQKAAFEFHFSNWIGPSGDKPILPEALKLSADRTLCIHGTEERESLCPRLAPLHARVIALPGGHHFDGDDDALARRIVDAAR